MASIVATLALIAAGNALACACCAEPGTWYERPGKLQKFEKEELALVKFGATAHDVPGFETNRTYKVTSTFTATSWTLNLSGLAPLVLRLPATATTFGTDLGDGRMGGGGGPLLYKEFRLTGSASGPGTRYTFVLQGRGNNCLNAADFRRWHLEVTGGKKPLEIYGTFR